MPYLRELPRPTCETCGIAAKKELLNRQNGHIAYYCTACGKAALKRWEKDEALERARLVKSRESG